ncbi:MAG: 5-formyltetrahydrofolate cyclo-ligase, partial [Gallionellaceae bacterium]|nr:5-formyltetrahydrofolate cyclo-ligase [Gallionellaceae bacterium]
EPVPARCVKAEAWSNINFILLPGVAFGRDGTRLGYGGGFYDKLIARLPHHPALVGAAYEMQIVEGIPQEATDHRVQWLVTDKETIDCST